MPDTSQGRVTPLSPGIVKRATHAVADTIKGAVTTWFGPLDPIKPMAPADVVGRRWDYPTGTNINYHPRAYEGVTYEELRSLADNCDVLRAVIETRKDQMESLDWNVKIRTDDNSPLADATDEQKQRIQFVKTFLRYPDKRNNWQQWLRMWMEELFVTDAACFYKRRDRGGELWGLEPIDGATIKVLIDDWGRTPLPPEPAYQQILKGIPAVNYASAVEDEILEEYTSNELMYLVRNPRVNKFTGYSHVQQILVTTNIFIRRAVSQLEFYQSGSVPDGWLMAPADWNIEQVTGFQAYLDSMLAGNLGDRRKVRVIPDAKYEQTKKIDLKDEYDEWLTRIVCYTFSVPPTPFVKQMNRATAESLHNMALEEGLAPLQKYVKQHLDQVITTDFNSPDLEFSWIDDREQDPEVVDKILVNDVRAGLISIDEARESKGLDPLGGPYAIAQALIGTGYVAPTHPEEQAALRQRGAPSPGVSGKQPGEADTAEEHPTEEEGEEPKPEDVSAGTHSDANAQKLLKRGVKKKLGRSNPYRLIGHLHAARSGK